MFGPVKETSLDMLSHKKRDAISETLIRSAVADWEKKKRESFTFEIRGETCQASVRDTWDDKHELSLRVQIREFDLYITCFYYPEDARLRIPISAGGASRRKNSGDEDHRQGVRAPARRRTDRAGIEAAPAAVPRRDGLDKAEGYFRRRVRQGDVGPAYGDLPCALSRG
jgi:hypothetical protein